MDYWKLRLLEVKAVSDRSRLNEGVSLQSHPQISLIKLPASVKHPKPLQPKKKKKSLGMNQNMRLTALMTIMCQSQALWGKITDAQMLNDDSRRKVFLKISEAGI